MSAIEKRRLMAEQVFSAMLHDTATDDGPVFELGDCVSGAIKAATRVKLTPEIQAAVYSKPWASDEECLKAAFEAAGFEVEQ